MDVLLTSLTTNADRPHDFEARNGDGLRKHTLITGTYPKLYRNRWLPKPLSVLDDLWQVRSNWTPKKRCREAMKLGLFFRAHEGEVCRKQFSQDLERRWQQCSQRPKQRLRSNSLAASLSSFRSNQMKRFGRFEGANPLLLSRNVLGRAQESKR